MLQKHSRQSACDRESRDEIEDYGHERNLLFSIAVTPRAEVLANHSDAPHDDVRGEQDDGTDNPAHESLTHKAPERGDEQVDQRKGQNELPCEVHQLILTQAG